MRNSEHPNYHGFSCDSAISFGKMSPIVLSGKTIATLGAEQIESVFSNDSEV